jgi:glycosyltransferase 2 family protein
LVDLRSRALHARLLLVLINLASLGCLVWTLRDAHLSDFRDDLASLDYTWVAVAVAADVLVYLGYSLRWSILLRPVVRTGFWRSARAVYMGLFANEVLPLRAGEVLRCYLLTRWTKLPFEVSLSSALIERILDGIWLCLCLLLTLHFVAFPPQFHRYVDGAWVLGLIVLGGALLLSIAVFVRSAGDAPRVPSKGWRRHLGLLLDGVGSIGYSRFLLLAFLTSLPCLLLQAIPIWASFQGYGFDLSLADAFALMVILRLISALPQAPGNIGLFQLLTKEVLIRIFNVVPDQAARFSVVLWGIVTLPLLIGGFVALWIEEADVLELKREAEEEAANLRDQG